MRKRSLNMVQPLHALLMYAAFSILVCPVPLFSDGTVDDDHGDFSRVLQRHVRNGLVDYEGIRSDPELDSYLERLDGISPETVHDTSARLALWINAYNAWTLKLIADHHPVASIRDISKDGKGPWDIPIARIGGRSYTLNEIEHTIIRTEFAEPLIHMALVCAAVGCPPLRNEAYNGAGLRAQLEDNASRFLSDSSKNYMAGDTLYVSEIFKWFDSDFQPVYGGAVAFVKSMPRFRGTTVHVVRYLPYNWKLNSR